jgi:ABC-2 type transport system ATP-binding protein
VAVLYRCGHPLAAPPLHRRASPSVRLVIFGGDGEGDDISNGLVLEAKGLRKTFGDRVAVDNVSFHIADGETYGLLGPNGAGKTTSISMVVGILERDGGEVTVAGRAIDPGATEAKGAIGLVPQDLAIYPDLTAAENLKFFARLYGLDGADLSRRVAEVLEIIELTDRADDLTEEYSGGMKRRLNIGIGLLHRPRLLVLDEPTVGVDPQSRNAILESVERLGGEGMAVLYTTHYMEEAERLCDRVGIIDLGKIIAEGSRRELVSLVGEQDRVDLRGSGRLGPATEAIAQVAGVVDAGAGDTGIEVTLTDAGAALPALLAAATGAGMTITGVEIAEPDLESVFLHLTGKALRD